MTSLIIAAGKLGWREFAGVVFNLAWVAAFLVRVVGSVLFVTLLAAATGAVGGGQYALFGNCVALLAIELSLIPQEMAKERFQGTLALLVASPGPLGIMFLVRYSPWFVLTFTSSAVAGAFVAAADLIHVEAFSPAATFAALLVLLLTAVGVYSLTIFVGALSLRRVAGRNIYSDLLAVLTLAGCGVVAPLTNLPPFLSAVGHLLPLTNGLQALREMADGNLGGAAFASSLVAQVLVTSGWLLVTLVFTRRLISRGLRDGSLSYS